jgi:hypothetical protein
MTTPRDVTRSASQAKGDKSTLDSEMTTTAFDEIQRLSEQHPKPAHIRFQYGTAGFRTMYVSVYQSRLISQTLTFAQWKSARLRFVQGRRSRRSPE